MPVSFIFSVASAGGGALSSIAVPGEVAGADTERDWALDPVDGDLQIGPDGDAVWVKGTDAIASDLESEFLMFLGEWYLDLESGFPWFQEVLGVALNEAQLRRRVEQHALLVPGVIEIQNYALTKDEEARSISISFDAKCNTGAVITATATAAQGGS